MKSYCKINLNLNILNKRDDNYHNISSLVLPLEYHDDLYIFESKEDNYISNLNIENNLIFKTIKLIKDKYNINKKHTIILNKKIPLGAGLGGGSSNSACVINYFNNYYNLNMTNLDKINIAKNIGSDVSLFLFNKPCIIKDKGDNIEFINFNDKYYVLLIYPNINIETKKVFENNKKYNKDYSYLLLNNFNDKYFINDLEESLYNLYPNLKELKNKIENKINNKIYLTGSGSTFFIINKNIDYLKKCQDLIINEIKLNLFLTNTLLS